MKLEFYFIFLHISFRMKFGSFINTINSQTIDILTSICVRSLILQHSKKEMYLIENIS